MKHNFTPLFVSIMLFFCLKGFSQTNQDQYFRLNHKEANLLYRKIKIEPDSSFFHTPISKKEALQKTGHYLAIRPKGEIADLSLHSTNPFRLHLLRLRNPLAFVVRDTLGQVLDSVEVLMDQKVLKYDAKMHCFRGTHAPKYSILEVRTPKHSAYFELTQNLQGKFSLTRLYRRFSSNRIGYWISLPLRIATSPIGFVYRGIRHHRWYFPWRSWFPRTRHKPMQGYIALNQPKYRPTDTLHLKAYVSSPKGRPLRQDLLLRIYTLDYKNKIEQKMSSNSPGAYHLDLPLADSLDLDKTYYINVESPRKKKWYDLTHNFTIEDYELDEVVYQANAANPVFHRGEKCSIDLSAQTTNQLPVPDAHAELFLLSGTVSRFYPDQVLLPDTIWRGKEELGARGKWSVQFPDSLLPAVSMNLQLHIYFNNSTGQLIFKQLNLTYIHLPRVIANPAPIIPSASGKRSVDSITIEILNEKKRPIWFQVKRDNDLVVDGYTQDSLWVWKKADPSTHPYELSYRYMLEDEMYTFKDTYIHYFKALQVGMQGPDKVFPGQTAAYEISVKRGDDRPAKGVDLSAGAINAQFASSNSFTSPKIGYTKRADPNKPARFTYQEPKQNYQVQLSRFMVKRLGLQDSLYYQYRHTQNLFSVWRDSSLRQDSFYRNVAQFAPFLVKEGKMRPIYMIYLNRQLVYYYNTQDQTPYSFAAPAGYNQIIVRTQDSEYILDSVYLHPGEKQELVINEDYLGKLPHHRTISRNPQARAFSSKETKLLERSIFVVRQLSNLDTIFIWDSHRNIHLLTAQGAPSYQLGPFVPGTVLNYAHMNYFNKRILFEPGFSYVVNKDRERLYQYQMNFPKELPLNLPHPKIGQYLISPQKVRMYSPPRTIITFNPVPDFGTKRTGSYQFEYPNQANLPDSIQLLTLVLEDTTSGEHWVLNPNTRSIPNMQPGQYKLLLFNQQKAFFSKSISISRDTLYFERLNQVKFQAGDSMFFKTLKGQYIPEQLLYPKSKPGRYSMTGKTYTINGKITDRNGEPLIGVNILVKGMTIGTVSDLDGNYQLELPLDASELIFSYTGFTTQPYSIGTESIIDVKLEESKNLLSEVVVMGYSTAISKSSTSSGSVVSVDAISARPLHDLTPIGAITKQTSQPGPPTSNTLGALVDSLGLNHIRTRFRDYAYWQPTLRSNRQGKAFFSVKFPEDITNWKSFVIAADKKLQAGVFQGSVQAYKPLMAQLNLPRFLLQGDQTTLIGRVLNYSGDTLALQTHFQAQGRRIFENNHLSSPGGLVDQTEFRAPQQGDSLQFSYALQTQTAYQDGEQRSISLKPVGTLESDGIFLMLERDTILDFRHKTGTLHFRAEPSILSLMLEDVEYLRNYPYGCNEQNASRLLGLLTEKQIRKALNETFTGEKMIQDVLSRLSKAQNQDGSWGWWAGHGENAWMGNYVIQALLEAKKMGYELPAIENGLRWLTSIWSTQRGVIRLQCLRTLLLAGQRIDTTGLLDTLNKPQTRLCDRLLCWQVKQALGFPVSLDTLDQDRYADVYGGAFWEDKKVDRNFYNWDNNRLANTLMAYQILKKAGLNEELQRIRTHLFINRGYVYNGGRSWYGWCNTLEVASVLKTILPDLLQDKITQNARLRLSGALQGEVSKYALQASFDASKPLEIKVNGSGFFFCTAYQQNWNHHPQPKSDLFDVKSHLEYHDNEVKQLQFGQPAQLVVEVDVKQEAQYVMVEIPIPAGCSYFKKPQTYRSPEVHREYFADKVSIFCERLPVGKQRFTVDLEPRFSGTYTLNPVRVEEMYFPVLYGRNGVEKVSIKP